MLFDVIGQRLERALDPGRIRLVTGGNVELRQVRLAEIIRGEEAVQIAALHPAVARDRAFALVVQLRERTCAIGAVGVADVDFVRFDRLLRGGMRWDSMRWLRSRP